MSVEDVVVSVVDNIADLLSEDLPKEIVKKLMQNGLVAAGIDSDCIETAIRLAIKEYWAKIQWEAAVPVFPTQISRHLENGGLVPKSPAPIIM